MRRHARREPPGDCHAVGARAGLCLRVRDQRTPLADLRSTVIQRGDASSGHGHDRVVERWNSAGELGYVEYARLGEYYYYVLVGVELSLVMLAAPAATAGAICLDRARGTLTHVLATDLSDSEIVLGKLAARLLPVLGLVACTWPVMAISSLLGGIDPLNVTMAFGVIVVVAVLGCSLALALSVWREKAVRRDRCRVHAVGCHSAGLSGDLDSWRRYVLSWDRRAWLLMANPFYLAIALLFGVRGSRAGGFRLISWRSLSGLRPRSVLAAVWSVRPVTSRGPRGEQIDETARRARQGDSVAARPIAGRQALCSGVSGIVRGPRAG